MGWWTIASAAISAYSSYNQSETQKDINAEQEAWNKYNAMMTYSTAMNNLDAQYALSSLNASMTMAAAKSSAATTKALAEYNSDLLYETAQYNDILYEQELQNLWSATNLDLRLMGIERAKERGEIEAKQSASGTVMGVDSNADVIIDQKTQEALDKFIVRHGADIQAAKINNARAQSLWAAEQKIGQVMFEGNLKANATLANASIASAGMMAEAGIRYAAGEASALSQLQSSLAGAELAFDQNNAEINGNFQSGLFSSIGSGVSSYLDNSDIDTVDTSIGTTTESYSYDSITGSYGTGGYSGWRNWPSDTSAGSSLINS